LRRLGGSFRGVGRPVEEGLDAEFEMRREKEAGGSEIAIVLLVGVTLLCTEGVAGDWMRKAGGDITSCFVWPPDDEEVGAG
jgi:hypothetical protein